MADPTGPSRMKCLSGLFQLQVIIIQLTLTKAEREWIGSCNQEAQGWLWFQIQYNFQEM